MGRNYHEDFGREQIPEPGSIGGFAAVMAVAFAIIAVIFHESRYVSVLLGLAALFPVLYLVWPAALRPLNRAWHALGLFLGRIVAPLIMGLVFYGVVTPIGLIRRLLGKDSLRLQKEQNASSYWIERDPPGPDPQHLPRQF